MSWWDASVSGIKLFFGYGKEINLYYVVAGSFKDEASARKHAQAINDRDHSYRAYVGGKTKNGYSPVLLGEAATLSEANTLKQKIVSQRVIHDAYLVSAENIKPYLSFNFGN